MRTSLLPVDCIHRRACKSFLRNTIDTTLLCILLDLAIFCI